MLVPVNCVVQLKEFPISLVVVTLRIKVSVK